MMTEEQIVSIVKKEISESAELYLATTGMSFDEDDPNRPEIVACTERMFYQDPMTKHLIVRNDNQTIDINDMKHRNTLFAVIMLSQGNHNFAVSQNQISIQILSEQGDFELAEGILRAHLNRVNYRSKTHELDGKNYSLIETYNNPDVAEDQMVVFAGLRALVVMRGIILVQDESVGTVTITNIEFTLDGETYTLPFISGSITNSQSPDPQAFPHGVYGGDGSDMGGWTSTRNRQSTLAVGIQTYLSDWDLGENNEKLNSLTATINELESALSAEDLSIAEKAMKENELETNRFAQGLKVFSRYIVVDVIQHHNFNKPIHLKLGTNVSGLAIVDSDFMPSNQSLAFQWGQYSLPTFTFNETSIV